MKKVIFLLLDGARSDILSEELKKNNLPNLKKIIDEGSHNEGVTVFPSTTGPAYIPFLTGTYPGPANMPGIRWFDKNMYSKRKFDSGSHRSYVGFENIYFNSDIKKSYKTLFELIPKSISIFNEITKGLKKSQNLTRNSKIFYKLLSHFYGSTIIDSSAFKKLFKVLNDDFNFYFCCLYGIDSISHIKGSDHSDVRELYKKFDDNLGLLVNKLKKNNLWNDSLLIITSDHGHTNTNRHFDLVDFCKSIGKQVFYYPLILQKFYKAFNCSVMVSGNSMAHIYLNENFNWSEKFNINNHKDFLNLLLKNDAVDIVAYKNPKEEIIVESVNGKAIIRDAESDIYYQPLINDPFKYNISEGFYSADKLLELTINTDYPDAIIQIVQIFKSNRSGDIIVSANNGYDFREKYEFPEHRSSHGSLRREHMQIPIILNKKIINDFPIRTIDIFSTILDFLKFNTKNNSVGKKLNIN